MNKVKLTDELRQWYVWAKEYSQGRKSYDSRMNLYFCSWWLGVYYALDTRFINRMMDRLVKLGYLTKEAKRGLYTKYTFTDKQMDDE